MNVYRTKFRVTCLILLVIVGCALLSGCYTKRQAIEKFCSQDTATTMITFRDTVQVESIHTDTAFSSRIDTFTLVKDKLTIQYKKVRDTVYLSGSYAGDTVYIEKTITVSVPCACPEVCPRSDWQKAKAAKWWIILAFVAGLSFGLYLQFRRK